MGHEAMAGILTMEQVVTSAVSTAERAGRIGVKSAKVTLWTEQAAAKVVTLTGMVEVKTATPERAAVLMGEASGLDTLDGLRYL
jgi:hypothetical protein